VKVDISKLELHNIERTPQGLRSRRGFVSVASISNVIGGFSIESASTSEVWHYIFTQASSGAVTLTVYTEEFVTMFTQDMGVMQGAPVITWGLVNNQIMINSPSFSAPLYGLPGGGLITAIKTASIQIDTTALDIPAGHIASFGDRFVIAQGNILFFNDPPGANQNDPRTFVGENAVALAGTVYDLFQGPDGALWVFTSAGVFTIPADALGQGQQVAPYISRVPGLETSRPRNAAASGTAIAVLEKNSVVLLPSGDRIDLLPRGIRRQVAVVTDIEDMRQFGEIFATSFGFVVGFGGKRGYWLVIDEAARSVSYWWTSSGLTLRGVLRGREQDTSYLTASGVIVPFTRSKQDAVTSADMKAVALGRLPQAPGQRPTLRHVTIQAENVSYSNTVDVNASTKSVTTPAKTTDVIVGTAVWGAATKLRGRTLRAMRTHFAERSAEPHVEIAVTGADFLIGDEALVELGGQGAGRRDAG
jgi:hypothetical protein